MNIKSILKKKPLLCIIIAIIIGLLICSLVSRKDLIEGSGDGPKDPAKPAKPVKPVKKGIQKIGKNTGICYGSKLLGNMDYVCAKLSDQGECGKVSGCSWRRGNDLYSYSGIEGSVFIEWMRNVGLMNSNNVLSTDISTEAITTGMVSDPLLPLKLRGPGISVDNKTKNNFLYHVGVTSHTDVTDNEYIPKYLQPKIKEIVKDCEAGWENNTDMYKYNGGRPIMTYSLYDGLVCRNPYYQPIDKKVGHIPRIYTNPRGSIVCPSPIDNGGAVRDHVSKSGEYCDRIISECGWENSGMVKSTSDAVGNNLPLTSSGACGLPHCTSTYPWLCSKETMKNRVYDWIGQITSPFNKIRRLGWS